MLRNILFFVVLLGCFFSKAQTFTDKEIIKLDSLLQYHEQIDSIQKIAIGEYELQISNYKILHEKDTLIQYYLTEELGLLNRRVNMYIELEKTIKPKWYDSKALWFIIGGATVISGAVVLDKIN